MNRPNRSLTVLASLPQVCAVCGNRRAVLRQRLDKPGQPGLGYPCPHCTPLTGASPIPIYIYPMRDDIPRESA